MSSAALIDLTPANGVNSNGAVSLADLLLPSSSPNGIVVGDKVFTDFAYTLPAGSDMPSPQNVFVLGFQDPGGNWGISFHGAFFDLPGGNSSAAQINYQVQVDAAHTQLGYRISDAHLFLGGVGEGNSSSVEVNENVTEQAGFLLHGFQSKTDSGQTSQQLSDARNFTNPGQHFHVTKFVTASAGAASDQPARLTVI